MGNINLAMLVVAGVAASAATVNAQDDATNQEVLRALNELRHEVSILKEQNRHLKSDLDELKKTNEATVEVSTVLPMEEIFEHRKLIGQQANRIDVLEARNASLQKSVDAVFNRPAFEAGSYCEYGCTAEPAWLVEAGLLNWRTRRSSSAYAGTLSIQPNGSFSNRLRETEFDRENGFRVALGRRSAENWDIMFRFTFFENDGDNNIGDATVDSDAIFANQIDRSLADQNALNSLFDNGQVDAAQESLSLKHYVYDVEFGKTIDYGRVTARPFGGFRFAEIQQDASIMYQNLEPGNDFDTYGLNSNVDMTGWGLRAGGQVDVAVRGNLSVFGRGAASVMLSEFRVQRSDVSVNQSLARTMTRSHKNKYHSVVPVMELAAGLRYERGPFFLSAGYEYSNWFNMYQHLGVVSDDDINDNTTVVRSDRGDLSFDGWFIDAGFSY